MFMEPSTLLLVHNRRSSSSHQMQGRTLYNVPKLLAISQIAQAETI